MPIGAGLQAPHFDAESLADTFHEVIENQGDFQPRREHLKRSGRKHFFNRCIDSFADYYSLKLPDFQAGRHFDNLWLDLAVQQNYELSLCDFVYDKNSLLTHVRGTAGIKELLKFYFGRFGIALPESA